METFILWLGFIGAWLVFAGAIYQATIELQEQDIETDRIRAAGKSINTPKSVSSWWWLIFPVKYILERRRSNALRRAYFKALLPEDAEALVAYFNKATGWLFVAAGGICLAAKETYELAQHSHWNSWIFWLLAAAMFFLSLINTIVRSVRTKKILAS